MLDSDPPTIADPDAPLDIDLYCLNCQYNLRGLSGDPIRCPECGRHNLRAAFHWTTEGAKRRLSELQTAADAFVLAGFLLVVCLALSVGSVFFIEILACAVPVFCLGGAVAGSAVL